MLKSNTDRRTDQKNADNIKPIDDYIDAGSIKAIRNEKGTILRVSINADYLKEHCIEGENELKIYYEPRHL